MQTAYCRWYAVGSNTGSGILGGIQYTVYAIIDSLLDGTHNLGYALYLTVTDFYSATSTLIILSGDHHSMGREHQTRSRRSISVENRQQTRKSSIIRWIRGGYSIQYFDSTQNEDDVR